MIQRFIAFVVGTGVLFALGVFYEGGSTDTTEFKTDFGWQALAGIWDLIFDALKGIWDFRGVAVGLVVLVVAILAIKKIGTTDFQEKKGWLVFWSAVAVASLMGLGILVHQVFDLPEGGSVTAVIKAIVMLIIWLVIAGLFTWVGSWGRSTKSNPGSGQPGGQEPTPVRAPEAGPYGQRR